MIRVLGFIAFLLLASDSNADQSQDDIGLYLFSFPGNSSASLAGTGADAPLAKLYVEDTIGLANAYANSPVTVIDSNEDVVVVTVNTAGTIGGDPSAQNIAASFVVDFDEPAVSELISELKKSHGEQPELGDLIKFTFDAIPEKTYKRDFDFASRVAQHGEGDCTEHAVLLTGLSRATGRPAKVVLGLMLVQTASEFLVYGHAWSEIYSDDEWKIADATMPATIMPEATIRYLPMMALSDEGPGYGFAMSYIISMLPKRVDLVTQSRFDGALN